MKYGQSVDKARNDKPSRAVKTTEDVFNLNSLNKIKQKMRDAKVKKQLLWQQQNHTQRHLAQILEQDPSIASEKEKVRNANKPIDVNGLPPLSAAKKKGNISMMSKAELF